MPRHLLLALAVTALSTLLTHAQTDRPNIVVIISDDAGFADYGFMDPVTGATTAIPTPNLDALRAAGTLFTSAYTSAVCSPSRAAIVTGSYPQRIGYEYNINNITAADGNPDGLSPDTPTIFDAMGNLGYTTGAIGKWHVGAKADIDPTTPGNRPNRQGVDEFFGILKGSRNYTVGNVNDSGTLRESILNPDGTVTDTILESRAPWVGQNVANVFGQGAVDFIGRHHAGADPFFLYVSFTTPHSPMHNSPDFANPTLANLTGKRKQYASMMLTMDKEIGRLIARLDDPDGDDDTSDSILAETYILFINDNGGASSNASVNLPLRNFKGSTYEGGIRVPMLIAGPGISPASTFDHPVHSIDILPTCVAAGGGTPPAAIDGIDLFPFVTGASPGPPHATVVVRNNDRVGIRSRDWKLVKAGSGSGFQLFDLATDLPESTDLAGENPAVVAGLLDHLTRYETTWDKPRHASLNSNITSINLNDRFTLTPTPNTSGNNFTTNLQLVGGNKLNGNFNADTSATDQRSFSDTPGWFNAAGGQSLVATRTNQPADGTRNAVTTDNGTRPFALDTSHTLSTGEIFRITYDWRDASGWQDGLDRFGAQLFTTADDTPTGTPNSWFTAASELSTSNTSYQNQTHISTPAPAAVNGRRLFLLIEPIDGGSPGDFARFDNVTLDRGTRGGTPDTTATVNWSDANTWTDPTSGNPDTLLKLDAFPGCILEFPTAETFSYTATNNLTRPSGLDFIANSLRFTGTGAPGQSATINGNPLLLTSDLDGNPPSLALDAMAPGFTFTLSNDLNLFDDLHITGDGTAGFVIGSQIADYTTSEPRSVTKSGTAALTLTKAPTHTGQTIIDAGTLTVGADLSLGPLAINPGGTLAVTGNLDITGATLSVTTPSATPFLVATYGTLTGTFATPPNGYTIAYADNRITLTPTATSPFETWATTTHNLTGADAAFTADPDADLIPNGIEFLTGSDPNTPNLSPLTVTRPNAALSVTFPTASAASSVAPVVEISTDLTSWQTASGTTTTTEPDFFSPGLGRTTITLDPGSTHHFLRLSATL